MPPCLAPVCPRLHGGRGALYHSSNALDVFLCIYADGLEEYQLVYSVIRCGGGGKLGCRCKLESATQGAEIEPMAHN